jgi:hypothetical protein
MRVIFNDNIITGKFIFIKDPGYTIFNRPSIDGIDVEITNPSLTSLV